MSTRDDVLAVLDDILSLRGRAAGFTDETPLLGALPELDSMAVAGILASFEERFGFVVEDDEIDAETFSTLGTLVSFVDAKLRA